MSQVDWTPSPTGEREALLRRRRLIQHDSLALTLGAVGIVLATILAFVVASWLWPNSVWQLVLIVPCLIADFLVARRVDRRRDALVAEIKAIDGALREEFGPGSGWFVDLLILHGAAPVGTDRGMLWIEGDRLFFSGHRTSFALTPDQAVGPVRFGRSVRGLRHETTLRLAHTTPAGPLGISVQRVPGSLSDPDASGPSLGAWTKLATKGGGQLPPLAPGPGLASRPRVLGGAVASSLFWLGAARLGLWVGDSGLVAAVVLAAASLATVLRLWFPIARWRAWYDLGRIEG